MLKALLSPPHSNVLLLPMLVETLAKICNASFYVCLFPTTPKNAVCSRPTKGE